MHARIILSVFGSIKFGSAFNRACGSIAPPSLATVSAISRSIYTVHIGWALSAWVTNGVPVILALVTGAIGDNVGAVSAIKSWVVLLMVS